MFPLLLVPTYRLLRVTKPDFNNLLVSPFYQGKDSTIVFDTSCSDIEFTLYLVNDIYSAKPIVTDTITEPGQHTYTYKNEFTRTKNKIYFEYKRNGKVYTSPQINRNLQSSSVFYIKNNEDIVSENTVAYLNSNLAWEERHVTYSFYNFDGLYVPKFYHKIAVGDFEVICDYLYHPFIDGQYTLTLRNVNHVFDDIDGASETVTFELNLLEEEENYFFALKKKIYVNRETLMLSSTYKVGYVQTSYIYLPRNAMQLQSEYKPRFIFRNFGVDKTTFVHDFEMKATKNIFGDCSNSQYCIRRESLWQTVFSTRYSSLYF